jgi:hypothetical protein
MFVTTSLATTAPKQLIYNYATIAPWKYEKFINKMLGYKIMELYKMQVSCKLDIYIVKCTHHIYSYNQSCLTLLASCTLVACDNYITSKINVTLNQ